MKPRSRTVLIFIAWTGILFVLLSNHDSLPGQRLMAGIASIIGGLSLTGLIQLAIGGFLADLLGRVFPSSDFENDGYTEEQTVNAAGDAEADVTQQQSESNGQTQNVSISVNDGQFEASQTHGNNDSEEKDE